MIKGDKALIIAITIWQRYILVEGQDSIGVMQIITFLLGLNSNPDKR